MVASVSFAFRDPDTTGSTDSYTTLATTLRFKNADNNTGTATDNPMVRPPSGTTLSYWKNIRVRVVTAPDTALLALKFKISAMPTISGGENGIHLAYSFIRPADYTANVTTAIPQKIGVDPLADQNWSVGRTSAAGTGGVNVSNHLAALGANKLWNDVSGSDMLLLQMEITGGTYTNGGSIQSFNMIASYNEI